MIDIHTHILPGLDDGSKSLENSLYFLEKMQQEGVTDVFSTPHYIQGEYDNRPEKIRENLLTLNDAAAAKGLSIRIHKGVEVYLTANITEDLNLKDYCLGDSNYLLVEAALNGFPANILEMLYKIVKKGYKPILAHPERFVDIIKNNTLVEDLIYRNVYMQANAGSFLGVYGDSVAQTVWNLFHKGFIHFIASDCHCFGEEYILPVTAEMLKEHYPDYPTDNFIVANPAKILANETVELFNSPVSKPVSPKGQFLSKILNFFYPH